MTTATADERDRSASSGATGRVASLWRRIRTRASLLASDRVALVVLAIAAVALAMRLVDLGVRAMHHDESLHAQFSWYFAEGRGYRHDPLMHGPLQFHLIAGLFVLFGDGDAIARIPAVVFGTLLVLTPLLLRRSLGSVGVVVTSVLLAIGPPLLYYSRFARNDILVAVFTVLVVVAIWRYRADGRLRWLVLLSAAMALSFAAKETAYLTAAVFLLYLEAAVASALLAQNEAARGALSLPARVALWWWLFLTAWIVTALWPLLGRVRGWLGVTERPREADLLLMLGTLVLPLLAAFVQIPLEALGRSAAGPDETNLATATFVTLLAAAVAVGTAWRISWWLLSAGVFFAILVPLYTSMFTHLDGITGLYWTSLDYWLAQQDVRRGAQPWYYYLMLLTVYEPLTLLVGIPGAAWLMARRDRLIRLFGWWFLGTLVALSLAGEKMPWLLVHISLPLAFIAGYTLGVAAPLVWRRIVDRRASLPFAAASGLASAAVVALALLALRAGVEVSYDHPDTPVEPLIYTQTSPELPELARAVRAAATEGDEQRPIIVDTTGSLSWPWAWYLRDLAVSYLPAESITAERVTDDTIVIAAQGTISWQIRARFPHVMPYVHRWWFPEEGYRGQTAEGLVDGLLSGELLRDWVAFQRGRVPPEAVGEFRGEVLFPAGTDVVQVEPPGARG